MSIMKKILTLAAPAMLLALAACTTGLPTQVSRFQAMPAPQGQSFVIQPAKADDRGGLEFAQYADLVRRHLTALGYTEARSPRDASFVVTLDYGVDQGRERVDRHARPFGDPWGYRRLRLPALLQPLRAMAASAATATRSSGAGTIPSGAAATTSRATRSIRASSTWTSAAPPTASRCSRATPRRARGPTSCRALVPNLIEAMFTGFPGNSGETVRITVMPPERERR